MWVVGGWGFKDLRVLKPSWKVLSEKILTKHWLRSRGACQCMGAGAKGGGGGTSPGVKVEVRWEPRVGGGGALENTCVKFQWRIQGMG